MVYDGDGRNDTSVTCNDLRNQLQHSDEGVMNLQKSTISKNFDKKRILDSFVKICKRNPENKDLIKR